MHRCWVTAHLYGEQMFIGVIALTQPCCGPVLHSSNEQYRMRFAQSIVAAHWCWVTAHLYV